MTELQLDFVYQDYSSFEKSSLDLWKENIVNLCQQHIEGDPEIINNFDRNLTVDEKLEVLSPEFRGSNMLCVEIVRRIINIRRGFDVRESVLYISACIHQRPSSVFDSLSTRWIVSIMDTFADHAPLPMGTAAHLLTSFVLGNRLGYSCAHINLSDVRQAANINNAVDKLKSVRELRRKNIWDNVIYFNFEGGDTYGNYLRRCQRTLRPYKPLYLALHVLMRRIIDNPKYDTLLTRDRQFNELMNSMFEEIQDFYPSPVGPSNL
jgi:hypothetical protein